LYYFDEEQKQLYESSCAAYEKALQATGKGRGKITTEIRAVQDFPEVGCDGRWDEVL
jgi:peptide methionine sulfoxide reductase MsrA